MYLRFRAENFKSLRRPSELSWVSTAQRDEPSWRIPSSIAEHGLLPVLGVYGANGSGKTNLLQALLEMRRMINDSFNGTKPEDRLPWTPWVGSQAPTRFDADVIVDGVRYHYGFAHDATAITEEWLYAWPKMHPRTLFRRGPDVEAGLHLGRELGGRSSELVAVARRRTNALFLSVAAQYEHPVLYPVWKALAGVRVERPIQLGGFPVFDKDDALLLARNGPLVRSLLAAADLGVVDFRPVVNDTRNADLLRVVTDALGDAHAAELRRSLAERHELWLTHVNRAGETWELAPEQESRGTNILLSRLNDSLAHLGAGDLMVIDEVDTGLHPDLCGALIALFTDPTTNPRHAQLVFSTHSRDLLARLRRDEVVLLDKGADGGTDVRVASDYKGSVRGRDDLARVHAAGRIRGVPVLGDLSAITREWHEAR